MLQTISHPLITLSPFPSAQAPYNDVGEFRAFHGGIKFILFNGVLSVESVISLQL